MLNIAPKFLLERDCSYETWFSKVAMIIFFRAKEYILLTFCNIVTNKYITLLHTTHYSDGPEHFIFCVALYASSIFLKLETPKL